MFSKRLIPILLISLLIFHGSLQLVVIKIFQAQHRREIFQSIDNGSFEDDLILFKFHKDDLEKGLSYIEWIEEDEFRIEWEMYDVVKREVIGDSLYLYCLHDKNESILYSSIMKIFNRLLGDEPNNARSLTSFNNSLSEFYFSTVIELNKFYLEESGRYLPIKTFSLLDGEPLIDTPPPRS